MIQDDDFYLILPSNANTNLFPTNSSSYYLHIAVDDEWNITFTTQDEWMLVAKPVAQALGWITHENKVRQSALFGLKIYSTLDQTLTYGYEWCALPLRYSFTFPGTFLIPLTVSLCRCTHKVVQVQN